MLAQVLSSFLALAGMAAYLVVGVTREALPREQQL
jgi:hypothetical protein